MAGIHRMESAMTKLTQRFSTPIAALLLLGVLVAGGGTTSALQHHVAQASPGQSQIAVHSGAMTVQPMDYEYQ